MEDARLRFYFPEKYGEAGLNDRFWITAAVLISMYAAWTLYKIKRPFLSLVESIEVQGIDEASFNTKVNENFLQRSMKNCLQKLSVEEVNTKFESNPYFDLKVINEEAIVEGLEKENEDGEQYATEEITAEDLEDEEGNISIVPSVDGEEDEVENVLYLEEDVAVAENVYKEVDETETEDVEEEEEEVVVEDEEKAYEDDHGTEGDECSSGSSDMCSEGCVTVYHLSEPEYESDTDFGHYLQYTPRLHYYTKDNNQNHNDLTRDEEG